jgi:hypothetical protein
MKKYTYMKCFRELVLRKMFGYEMAEEGGRWRKLHSEGLLNVYCSPYSVMMSTCRRMRWTEHARTHRREFTEFWKENS